MGAERKKKTFRTIAALSVVLLSIAGGLLYSAIAGQARKKDYPRPFADTVSREAAAAGIPEAAAYAAIKISSEFDPAFSGEDGKRGLFGFTPELFSELASQAGESDDPRLLFDPEVSVRFGCRYLASLYKDYLSWEAVWTAFAAGRDEVDAQIETDGGFNPASYGQTVRKKVKTLLETVKIYETLYPELIPEESRERKE